LLALVGGVGALAAENDIVAMIWLGVFILGSVIEMWRKSHRLH
jgi:hypothetical protein